MGHGVVALDTHSKVHLCHLLLAETIEWAVCLRKVEGVEGQEIASPEKLGGVGGCKEMNRKYSH